MIINYVGIFEQ